MEGRTASHTYNKVHYEKKDDRDDTKHLVVLPPHLPL